MNLITDPWIPVRCRSGRHRLISPMDLTDSDDPAVDLAAIRPDFNGALAQFLVGLFQWRAPDSNADWRGVMEGRVPLELERLRELGPCFEFDAGPRRFMQDMDFEAEEVDDLSSLLLNAPGDNTIKNNADLFVKRRDFLAISLPIAAQMLLTMQINASAGGSGHRTSLRGGGPVTMLLWPERLAGKLALLWQKAWLNTLVLQGAEPRAEIAFPWSTTCLSSEQDEDVRTGLQAWSPSDLELALLCYFSTPRRIRLRFDNDQTCSLSAERGRCAIGFEMKNLGANYKSDLFRHPMSPYYRSSGGDFLPVHVRNVGFTYGDWIRAQKDSEDSQIPAVLGRSRLGEKICRALDDNAIWAFGYAMEKDKCLAWHESRYPELRLEDETQRARVMLEAQRYIDGTEFVRRELGKQLRAAWSNSGKGDINTAARELYALTEQAFYQLVRDCAGLQGDDATLDHQHQTLLRRWHKKLTSVALHLFERHAERGDVSECTLQAIERAAFAQRRLNKALQGGLKDILQLDVAERAAKSTKRRKAA